MPKLHHAAGHDHDFSAARFLYDNQDNLKGETTEENRLIWLWSFLAARDGGMTIYHCGQVLDAIRSAMHNLPVLTKEIGHRALRSAAKNFRSTFPLYEGMRHAIAHEGEFMANKDRYTIKDLDNLGRFATTDSTKSATLYVSNIINGGRFTTTFEGQVISYDLRAHSLAKLKSVSANFRSALIAITG